MSTECVHFVHSVQLSVVLYLVLTDFSKSLNLLFLSVVLSLRRHVGFHFKFFVDFKEVYLTGTLILLGEIAFVGTETDLDREARQAQPYVLTVTATDHGLKPLSDHCIVEIYLLDVNDNSPLVLFPNVTENIFYLYILPDRETTRRKNRGLSNDNRQNVTVEKSSLLKNSLLIGSSGTKNIRSPDHAPVVITTIKAEDPDEGENGRVRYVLSGGNRQKYFAVDNRSGKVLLNVDKPTSLRKVIRGCHVIEVEVKDLGKSPRKSLTWASDKA